MAFDAHKNFAYSTVATAPSPADTDTTLIVASGGGLKFPAVPFNATIWPASSQPFDTTSEVVRVTNIVVDTLTIVRGQEGNATGRVIIAGDQIAATITKKTLTDIETAFLLLTGGVLSGLLTANAGLTVNGLSTLVGNTTITGFANISTTLQVAGLSTLTGNVTLSGFANIATSLNVGTTSHLVGALTVDANTTLTGNATLSGFANIAQTLNVAGISQHTGNATFGGFVNIASTLQIVGSTTLANTISANGSVGSATDVLTSGGAGANVYWAAAGGGGGSTNSFGTIQVAGDDGNLIAETTNSSLLIVADAGIVLTTNVGSDGALHITANLSTTTLSDVSANTFTPADGSGAGLTFVQADGSYVRQGDVVHWQFLVFYPVTVNGNVAEIDMSGIPFPLTGAHQYAGIFAESDLGGITAMVEVDNSNPAMTFFVFGAGGAAVTNAQLSGATLQLSGTYLLT
jgi:hypothetical protein